MGLKFRGGGCSVAQSGQRSCISRVAQSCQLHNPTKELRKQSCAILKVAQDRVAQAKLSNPTKELRKQSWELRKQSWAILEVARAELSNPGSCASQVAQSDQRVAQAKLHNPKKLQNRTLFFWDSAQCINAVAVGLNVAVLQSSYILLEKYRNFSTLPSSVSQQNAANQQQPLGVHASEHT